MTTKAEFSTDEWAQLLQAPMTAAVYIAAADPSVFGSPKELYAAAKDIAVAAQQPDHSELMAAMLTDLQDKEASKQAQPDFASKQQAELLREALDKLKAATSLMNEKATAEETGEITQWLHKIAVDAANASREGGFLGFGSVRVSESEKAALKDVADALGVEPTEG